MFRLIPLLFLLVGCATTFPKKDLVGKKFISVTGTSLEGKKHQIPQDFLGEPIVYLIGYVQDSQFDIDRWLIGLDMTKTRVKAVELPTIKGLFPRMFKTKIDEGMRRGIPKDLWGGVITIYKDGERVQKFTGNERPNNSRVMLLGPSGEILFFHDDGFSVNALNQLKNALEAISSD